MRRSDGRKRSASTDPNSCAKRCAGTWTSLPPRATLIVGKPSRSTTASGHCPRSRIGAPRRTGRIGQSMQRGEIWFAATPGGDRPVLVLTRDPVSDRIGAVVVAALTRTRRGLVSELALTIDDGVPTDSVVNFDNIHTIPRESLRRMVTLLSPSRIADACRTLQAATGC